LAKSAYLVEDSRLLRRQIVAAIEETGLFSLAGTAARATEAIREIRFLRPDVLILDLQLEEGSGWDVFDAAGGHAQHVIVLTNHTAAPFRAAAAERKIEHFFDKTSQFDAFLAHLCVVGKI
jgi:DNA-binding NarL/FixJ family response regulator